jgi:hypothetical protein
MSTVCDDLPASATDAPPVPQPEPTEPPHCAVCASPDVVYLCPEHGGRCPMHVVTHNFCTQPKTMVRYLSLDEILPIETP